MIQTILTTRRGSWRALVTGVLGVLLILASLADRSALATAAAPLAVTPSPTLNSGLPGLPHTLFGTLTLDGSPAPNGTLITVLVGGAARITTTTFTQNTQVGLYTVNVPGSDGDNGQMVTFVVSGYIIGQSTTWQSGAVTQVNLAALTPTATPTANATATAAAAATQTAVARVTQTAVAAATQTATAAVTPSQRFLYLPAVVKGVGR